MTVDNDMGGVRADPLYAEGMAALQEGRWKDALRAFETLAGQYPDDPTAQAALEQAELRARLAESGGGVRAKRYDIHWRPILFRGVLLLVVVALGVLVWQLIATRVAPAQAVAREQQQRAQLLKDGLAFLDGNQLDMAEEKLTALLALDPANAEAQAGLVRIADRRELDAACVEADAVYAAGDLPARARNTSRPRCWRARKRRPAVRRGGPHRRHQQPTDARRSLRRGAGPLRRRRVRRGD